MGHSRQSSSGRAVSLRRCRIMRVQGRVGWVLKSCSRSRCGVLLSHAGGFLPWLQERLQVASCITAWSFQKPGRAFSRGSQSCKQSRLQSCKQSRLKIFSKDIHAWQGMWTQLGSQLQLFDCTSRHMPLIRYLTMLFFGSIGIDRTDCGKQTMRARLIRPVCHIQTFVTEGPVFVAGHVSVTCKPAHSIVGIAGSF